MNYDELMTQFARAVFGLIGIIFADYKTRQGCKLMELTPNEFVLILVSLLGSICLPW